MRRMISLGIALLLLFASLCPVLGEESEHYMGKWHYRRDGLHRAYCLDEGCDFYITAPCSALSITYGGETFTACPVCGHNAIGDGRHRRCLVQLYDYSLSPVGDVLVNQYRYPFGRESDIVSTFSVIFESAGVPTVYEGGMTLRLTIDCPAAYELLRVEGEELVFCESSYDALNQRLTFDVPSGSWMFAIRKTA